MLEARQSLEGIIMKNIACVNKIMWGNKINVLYLKERSCYHGENSRRLCTIAKWNALMHQSNLNV